VFRASTAKVNGALASLPPDYDPKFASGHSNDRVKIDSRLHPVVLKLVF